MGKVILLCGKICSGKSFYSAQTKSRENAVILSTDEVTWDLTDNAQGEGYDAFAARVNAYLLKKSAEIAQAGCNVILDRGFWTRAERLAVSEYLRQRNVSYEWHYLDTDDETLMHNIEERNQKVLAGEGGCNFYVDEGLLSKVLSRFEIPERSEIDVWVTNRR